MNLNPFASPRTVDQPQPSDGAYMTVPPEIGGMPPGVPYIVGNEAAERFSFYGMRGILHVYMTHYLLDAHGNPDVMSEPEAKYVQHLFIAGVYFFPFFGALLSDALFGKYRTIILLSLVYCLGHLVLAVDTTRLGLYWGLGLIAIGSGGIKPCVSAHVGDQFGVTNQHLLTRVFSWFYFSINIGSFIAELLIPWLRKSYGPHVAFGVPGVLMLLATLLFWMGRNKFVHIPPGGMAFVRETFSLKGFSTILRLVAVFACITMFWSLFDQTASSWVGQASRMDLVIFGSVEIEPDQMQAFNPLLVMMMVPLFSLVIYPQVDKLVRVTPLRKAGTGMFLAALAFMLSAQIEHMLDSDVQLSVLWQMLPYVVITAAEVLVSITMLEFAYTQAPKRMKSLVMSVNMLSITAGNLVTALVNYFIKRPDGTLLLSGANYYWFFTGLMFLAALAFVGVASIYEGKTYIQDGSD